MRLPSARTIARPVGCGPARLVEVRAQAVGGRVDHRVAVVALDGLRLRGVLRGADHPRLDAELAEVQGVVGLERDLRARDERELLAARVLEQVGAQLVADLVLDLAEALAVVGREPDDVLVRDVRARDRDRAVLVHLLGQAAGQLGGPDLGLEDTAERPLHEVGDLALEAPEHGHGQRAAVPGGVESHATRSPWRKAAAARATAPATTAAGTVPSGSAKASASAIAPRGGGQAGGPDRRGDGVDGAACRPRTSSGSTAAAAPHSAARASDAGLGDRLEVGLRVGDDRRQRRATRSRARRGRRGWAACAPGRRAPDTRRPGR